MGKPRSGAAASTPSHGLADDQLSMHTTRSDYDYDDARPPPSYSDSETAPAAPTGPVDDYPPLYYPKAPAAGWQRSQKNCTPATAVGSETSIRMDERLNDPYELERYISDYLQHIPPDPKVRVQGWHWETRRKDNKNQQERIFDFDIVLSLRQYLADSRTPEWWSAGVVGNSTKTHRGSVFKIRAPGSKQDIEVGNDDSGPLLLKDWCQAFTDSPSSLKLFRVTREITGLDTALIADRLTTLVRSTHYRGHVDITFPVADKNIDIYSPHWINRARIGWVRWLFYLTFLWIFTWPLLFFMTKKWDVYRVEWRYSYVDDSTGRQNRRWCSLSEAQWVEQYSRLIKSLVWEKFQGDATDMPTDVNPDSGRPVARGGRMPSTGNANVDSAVNLIHGGVSVWNAMNGRGSRGGNEGWGADS